MSRLASVAVAVLLSGGCAGAHDAAEKFVVALRNSDLAAACALLAARALDALESTGGCDQSWPQYLASADFWNRTLQNWQSEFLAIASMAILSVYLRQRGPPESKPVGAAHSVTEESG